MSMKTGGKKLVKRKHVDRGDSPAATTVKNVDIPATPEAVAELSPWELDLCDRLNFIKDYGEVTVPQFRNFANLGSDARRMLDEYIAQDLVVKAWRQSKGLYSLTPAGEARLAELKTRK